MDDCRHLGFNSIPDCNDDFFTVLPDKAEWESDDINCSFQNRTNQHDAGLNDVFNGLPDSSEEGDDAIPDSFKEGLYIGPDLIPASAKPAEYDISNTLDNIQDIGEEAADSVPDGREDFLHASPCLRPVSSKDADKDIKDTGDDTSHRGEDIGDVIKHSFKDRSENLTKSIPDCF